MNQPKQPAAVKRGTELELDIEKFAGKDQGLARVDGLVVFVRGGVPGDRVRAAVYKRKKSYAEAEVEEVLQPSADRTEPRCFYFPTCGGCTRQHVRYEAQLEAKRQAVREALVHHGGLEDTLQTVEVRPVIASPKPYLYRNHMGFNFAARRWLTPTEIASGEDFDTQFALGLHPASHPFSVLDLEECHLHSELSQRLVNGVRRFVKERGWQPWDIKRHTGFLRHLVLRTGEQTGEAMVNLVTNGHDAERMSEMAAWLEEEFPEVDTFVNTVNTGKAQTAYGEAEHVLFGPGVIHDRIGPHTFEISPAAFFQTNTLGAERLYDVARAFAEFKPTDRLYDLYCGTGTISIFMADGVEEVVGIELSDEAVENARANAAANGARNCTFVGGDMLKLFTDDFIGHHGRPDVLIADPPRAGMHKKVVQRIAEVKPERFVYVSCNPQTQARDLKGLAEAYAVEAIQPVDMFPQTHHIENVVKLRARG